MSKFNLGKIVATPTALEAVPNSEILVSLTLHQAGEWGPAVTYARESGGLYGISSQWCSRIPFGFVYEDREFETGPRGALHRISVEEATG